MFILVYDQNRRLEQAQLIDIAEGDAVSASSSLWSIVAATLLLQSARSTYCGAFIGRTFIFIVAFYLCELM